MLPPVVKLAELKTDAPVPMPNTPPGSNTWLINAKIVLAPMEDLLDLPPKEDTTPIKNMVDELNGLIHWRNAYAHSIYARTYGEFDIQVPVDSVPQLLVVQQAKGKSLAPLYGKVAAEWQVDHWQFSNVDIGLPAVGRLRSSFAGATMVKGSPEAESILAVEHKVIDAAKQRQAEIESRYSKDLLAATKPGTIYRGQISHTRGVLPCEVRFMDTPGADPQVAMFEVTIPKEPTYQLIYTAKLALKVPLNVSDSDAASETIRIPSASTETELPVANLTVSIAHGTGKKSNVGSLPTVLHYGTEYMRNKPFLLLDNHLKGVVAQFNGDFSLSVERAQINQ